jgi:tetratricopeptide (TPR) repeat protein
MGAQVVSVPWANDFAAARNAAVAACRGTWVLAIDADERLECHDLAELSNLLHDESVTALQLPIRSYTTERRDDALTVENWIERLFRREHFRYEGRIHERVVAVDGSQAVARRTRALSFVHEGYRPSIVEARAKSQRNLELAEAMYAAAEDDAWYRAFVLGRSLKTVGRYGDAAAMFREALDMLPADRVDYRVHMLCDLAHCALERSSDDEALAWSTEAVSLSPDHGQARYLMGVALNRLGRHREAREVLTRLVRTRSSDGELMVDHVAQRFLGAQELGVATYNLGDHRAACTLLLDACRLNATEFTRWPELLEVLRRTDGPGWMATAEKLAEHAPANVIAAATTLPASVRLAFCEHLVDRGWSPEVLAPVALEVARQRPDSRHRWLQRLAGTPALGVIAARWEQQDPAFALDLWSAAQRARNDAAVGLGRARCLVGLGRLGEAVDALNAVDLGSLAVTDRLFVAAIAASVGDVDAAGVLVDSVPDDVDVTLRGEVLRIAALAGADVLTRTTDRLPGALV